MSASRETILQFGVGRFLRAFADLFVHQVHEVGQIVVVQSTGSDRVDALNRASGRYSVVIRGLDDGQVVDHAVICSSISRGLSAPRDWPEVLSVARSPSLQFIISNTTEAGYELSQADDSSASSWPASFPAKLLAVLFERWSARQPPIEIVPCELRDENARVLHGIVRELAELRGHPSEFLDWMSNACRWRCTLVDRIVPGPPPDRPDDALAVMAEPYALWAIESDHTWLHHPNIIFTDDVKPYFLRKVRILNGAHTALVAKFGASRFPTVLDAMNDPETAAWLERLLFQEIVPTIADRVVDATGFARQTLDRFRNPFFQHRLNDIATNHGEKTAIRLATTLREFELQFGRPAKMLRELIPAADS